MSKPNKAYKTKREMVLVYEKSFGQSEIMAEEKAEELRELKVYDMVRKTSYKIGPKRNPMVMWMVRAYNKPKKD